MFTRIVMLTVLLTAACTSSPVQNTPPPQDIPFDSGQRASEVTAIPSPAVEDELEKKLTQRAMDDLAARLNLNVAGISVVSTESLVWPNTALGCPLPGKVYAEGTVPGFRINLKAGDESFSYHTDQNGQILLCDRENQGIELLPEFPVTPGEIQDEKPWMPVD